MSDEQAIALLEEMRLLRGEIDSLRAEFFAHRDAKIRLATGHTNPDPWLTRAQAEAHLNVSRTAFFRLRREYGNELKPVCLSPLRWSQTALDAFKARHRFALMPVRPGRKPKPLAVAA
jgi:hypothetical protein